MAARFPYPLEKGDKLRAYQQIRHLAVRHKITLIAGSVGDVPAEHAAKLEQWCERVEIVRLSRAGILKRLALGIAGDRPFQVSYFASRALAKRVAAVLTQERYDLVHAFLPRVLPAVESASAVPVFVDLMDAFSLSVQTRLKRAPWWQRPAYRVERDRLRAYERTSCLRYPSLSVTSRLDQRYLDAPNVVYLPNGVDLEAFAPATSRARPVSGKIVMTGNMGYQPNVDAAVWFVREVWPRVFAEQPALSFAIVGTRPAPEIRALTDQPGVSVVGEVADVAAVLHSAEVAVCPMRCGSGIQNKLLEAMATGTAVVSTPLGNSGVEGVHERDLLVADGTQAFGSAVLRLARDPALRMRLGCAGRTYVQAQFSWLAHARALEAEYERVMASARPAALRALVVSS